MKCPIGRPVDYVRFGQVSTAYYYRRYFINVKFTNLSITNDESLYDVYASKPLRIAIPWGNPAVGVKTGSDRVYVSDIV
jgi:hypothetical protein